MGKPRNDGMPTVHVVTTNTSGGAVMKDTTGDGGVDKKHKQSKKWKQLKALVYQLQEARQADEVMIQQLRNELARSRNRVDMNNEEMREELMSCRSENEKLQQELIQSRHHIQHIQQQYLLLNQQKTVLQKEVGTLREQLGKEDGRRENLKEVIRQKKAKINLAIEKCEKYKAKNKDMGARLKLCTCQMNPQRSRDDGGSWLEHNGAGTAPAAPAAERRQKRQTKRQHQQQQQQKPPAPIPEETQQLLAIEQGLIPLPITATTQQYASTKGKKKKGGVEDMMISPMPNSISISAERDTMGDISSLPINVVLPPGAAAMAQKAGMPPMMMASTPMPDGKMMMATMPPPAPPPANTTTDHRRVSAMAVVGDPGLAELTPLPRELGVPAEIQLTGAQFAPKEINPNIISYVTYWDEEEIKMRKKDREGTLALGMKPPKRPGESSSSSSSEQSSTTVGRLEPEVNTKIPGFRLQESPVVAWRLRKEHEKQKEEDIKAGKRRKPKKQKDPWKDRWKHRVGEEPWEVRVKNSEFTKQANALGHTSKEYVVEANGDVKTGKDVSVTKWGIFVTGETAIEQAEERKREAEEAFYMEQMEEEERLARIAEEEMRAAEAEAEQAAEERRLRNEQRAREIAEKQAREEEQRKEREAAAAAKKAEEEAAAAAKKAEEDRLAKEKAEKEAAEKAAAAAANPPAAAAPAPPPAKKKSMFDSSSDDDSSVGYKPPPAKAPAAAPAKKKKSFFDSSSSESS